MKPDAFLVEAPKDGGKEHAVFLDVHRAVDYAARHNGIVVPLIRTTPKPAYPDPAPIKHG